MNIGLDTVGSVVKEVASGLAAGLAHTAHVVTSSITKMLF